MSSAAFARRTWTTRRSARRVTPSFPLTPATLLTRSSRAILTWFVGFAMHQRSGSLRASGWCAALAAAAEATPCAQRARLRSLALPLWLLLLPTISPWR